MIGGIANGSRRAVAARSGAASHPRRQRSHLDAARRGSAPARPSVRAHCAGSDRSRPALLRRSGANSSRGCANARVRAARRAARRCAADQPRAPRGSHARPGARRSCSRHSPAAGASDRAASGRIAHRRVDAHRASPRRAAAASARYSALTHAVQALKLKRPRAGTRIEVAGERQHIGHRARIVRGELRHAASRRSTAGAARRPDRPRRCERVRV